MVEYSGKPQVPLEIHPHTVLTQEVSKTVQSTLTPATGTRGDITFITAVITGKQCLIEKNSDIKHYSFVLKRSKL